MTDNILTNQQSLELIARMIRNSQSRFERGAGKPFLIWGYTTLAVSLGVWYLLKTTANPQWNWLWFAIPVFGLACTLLTRDKGRPAVTTFIDRAIYQVWLILGVCVIGVSLVTLFVLHTIPVLFIIALIVLAGEAITGGIIGLNYIKIAGLAGIVLSFGLFLLHGMDQVLGFGGIFLAAMIIPGHIMNAQAKKIDKAEAENHV